MPRQNYHLTVESCSCQRRGPDPLACRDAADKARLNTACFFHWHALQPSNPCHLLLVVTDVAKGAKGALGYGGLRNISRPLPSMVRPPDAGQPILCRIYLLSTSRSADDTC